MALVKLDATTSTNDFLKDLAANQTTENFTVVTAESQTDGRGQMGAKWVAESGKNLMMSVLVKDKLISVNQLFSLNVSVALAIAEEMERHDIPNLSIKWPNDIMSGNKKIGGILIENSFKPNGQIVSIIGIGLNINQTDFENLPKAGSLRSVSGREFDKEIIRDGIVEKIIRNVAFLAEHDDLLWQNYLLRLFKIGTPMPFQIKGKRFMGIITGVTRDGKLELKHDDDRIAHYAVKEIEMLY